MIQNGKSRIADFVILCGKAAVPSLYRVTKGLLTYGRVIFVPFANTHWIAEVLSKLPDREYSVNSYYRTAASLWIRTGDTTAENWPGMPEN